jgi:hypothetical protein
LNLKADSSGINLRKRTSVHILFIWSWFRNWRSLKRVTTSGFFTVIYQSDKSSTSGWTKDRPLTISIWNE